MPLVASEYLRGYPDQIVATNIHLMLLSKPNCGLKTKMNLEIHIFPILSILVANGWRLARHPILAPVSKFEHLGALSARGSSCEEQTKHVLKGLFGS